jgi:hypothetical protein
MRIAILSLSLLACGPIEPELVTANAAVGPELIWLGDTHLGYDGWWIPSRLVMSDRPLEVYAQTYPMGAAAEVRLYWADPAQASIRSAVMTFDSDRAGPFHHNTQWKAVIPASELAADQRIDYWVRAEDRSGAVLWDSRDGLNYSVTPRSEIDLYDGSAECWRTSGPGSFSNQSGALHAHPDGDLGLVWCALPTPADFELTLEWSMTAFDDNAGVMIRFPDPESLGYQNPAWVPVHYGFEVQIDEIARPDGAAIHRTGAIYGEAGQRHTRRIARPPGEWNRFSIRALGQRYLVELNGEETSSFEFPGDPTQPLRALPSSPSAPRFIGLQAHSGTVRFRAVRLRALP